MKYKSKIRKFQLLLLQLYFGYKELDDALASYKPLYRSLRMETALHTEWRRRHAKQELMRLRKRIDYLKRCQYVISVKEGEERLLQLTKKGEYEVLKLRFLDHMMVQGERQWDRRFRFVIFDIPEEHKNYRNFFRHLLRKSSCKMLQRSVWITPYNPQPYLQNLLCYLDLEQYFECLEVEYGKCSRQLIHRYKP